MIIVINLAPDNYSAWNTNEHYDIQKEKNPAIPHHNGKEKNAASGFTFLKMPDKTSFKNSWLI